MPGSGTKTDGTQAIRRAAAILRHVARGQRNGVSLREVSEAMHLSRSTAHRILKCLLDENLVDYSEDGGHRYVIGSLAFELGLVAKNRQREVMEWRPTVDALCAATGATVHLMARTGNEAICLYKAEASSVVRVIPVEVGQRRPLGVGAGATALLAAAADDEVEHVLGVVGRVLDQYSSLTVEQIRENVAAARATGFAESRGKVAKGVYGLAMAVPENHGPVTLAISLAAHESIVDDDVIASWKRQIAAAIRSRLKASVQESAIPAGAAVGPSA